MRTTVINPRTYTAMCYMFGIMDGYEHLYIRTTHYLSLREVKAHYHKLVHAEGIYELVEVFDENGNRVVVIQG